MTDVPPELRRLLDALPSPALPPVDVAAILGREVERQRTAARFWQGIAVAAVAAGVLLAVLWPSGRPSPELDALRDRVAKLEAMPAPVRVPPDDPRLEAKLADLSDLLLTLAADVDRRDERQKAAIRALAKQVAELRSLSDSRWAEARTTSDALYTLHQTTRKESKP